MHAPTSSLLAALVLAPLGVLASPTPVMGVVDSVAALSPRQAGGGGGGRRVKFCSKMDTEPTEAETKARFDKFADAFIVKKDIVEAFGYIAPEYINHNPMAKNGAQFAFDLLSPFWGSQQITVIRTLFRGNMGWLNYRSSFGIVVDRYRWEKGCIVEHWDAGERMPPA